MSQEQTGKEVFLVCKGVVYDASEAYGIFDTREEARNCLLNLVYAEPTTTTWTKLSPDHWENGMMYYTIKAKRIFHTCEAWRAWWDENK